ncbi:MAG: DUF2330 domain-containing protein [Phycisphaeraceae bacterium]
MLPEDYLGHVGQAEQVGLLIHRDGLQDLILGIRYEITPDEHGALPSKLTWLIALPSEPLAEDGYGLAEASLFDELSGLAARTLVRRLPRPEPKSTAMAEGVEEAVEEAADGVELGRAVKIGPYDIQPVRGVGQNALDGLNDFLERRGFPVEDPAHMAWFVEHGFTFLCIEVNPLPGEGALPSGDALPPLRVRFETEHPYYPLRYSSQQGDFDLSLYTLTDRSIDLARSAYVLQAIGWQNTPGSYFAPYRCWKAPQRVATETMFDRWWALESMPASSRERLEAIDAWSFGLFLGRPNPEHRPIASWTGDCYFTLKGQNAAPLGTVAKLAE